MATMVRDLIDHARGYIRSAEKNGVEEARPLLDEIDAFLERNHIFYTQCAVEHGEMALYYLRDEIVKQGVSEWQQKWDLDHAVSNAREAWHYANLLSEYWVQEEIDRQAKAARDEDRVF